MKPTTRNKSAKTRNPAITDSAMVPDECQRLQEIAMAAYFKAESRGFAPGGELDDWLVAEKEFEAAGDLARMAI